MENATQPLLDFEKALLDRPDEKPMILAAEIGEKYGIPKQKLFVDFFKKHQTHVFEFRSMANAEPIVQACHKLKNQIHTYRELDIMIVGYEIADEHNVHPLELAKKFRSLFELGPYDYHRREWDGFPNGGGNAAYRRAREAERTARNNINPHSYSSGHSPTYTPSVYTERTYVVSAQDQAWQKLRDMANQAKLHMEKE